MGELHDLLAKWETEKKTVSEWSKVEEKKADKIYVMKSILHSIWNCFLPTDITKVVTGGNVDNSQ